jgi:hypothetical protein
MRVKLIYLMKNVFIKFSKTAKMIVNYRHTAKPFINEKEALP